MSSPQQREYSKRAGMGRPDAIRVTQAQWRQTEDPVSATLLDGPNINGNNLPLWLSDPVNAFAYIGVLKDNRFTPGKSRLFYGDTVVSIILPSGVSKLQHVFPSGNHPEYDGAAAYGITGINGDLDSAEDYAYVLLGEVISSLRARYKTRLDLGRTAFGPDIVKKPWFLAEKADGTCVVFDVRQMPTFTVYTDGYPSAEVCNYNKRRWIS